MSKKKLNRNMYAFFPEIAAKLGVPKPNMAGTGIPDNNLGQSSETLWSTLADEWVDTLTKRYAPLRYLTTEIKDNVVAENPAVRPVVHVEVIDDAGVAAKNPTNWEQTAFRNHYEPVTLNRFSRSLGLSSYDIANGERVHTKIGALCEAVMAGVWAEFSALWTTPIPTAETTSGTVLPPITSDTAGAVVYDALTPETIAQQVSTLFGDYGDVDNLILTPTAFGAVVPSNALSLNPEDEGAYGIRHITKSAGLGGLGKLGCATKSWTVYGLALRRNACCMAAALPMLNEFAGIISTRMIGEIAGIPLLLKTWVAPGQEQLWVSVETMVGFAVSNPQGAYVLGSRVTDTAA